MWLFVKKFWPVLAVAAALLLGYIAIKAYGNHKYQAGVADTKLAIERENARLTAAMQEEKDRAEAQYRGAVLARQAIESTLRDRNTRITSLLSQLRAKSTDPSKTTGRVDGTSADWIGLFGACYAEYERVGKDAARYADLVNGWQLYYKAVTVEAK